MLFIQTAEPIIEDSYRRAICVVADENGDSVPDFVVADGQTNEHKIVVDLRSGRTQRRLWRATIESPDVDCITLIRAGDVNCDGREDVILSTWWVDVVYVLSGSDGSVIRRFENEKKSAWRWPFGRNVCASDFDLDGTPDVAVDGVDACSRVCKGRVSVRSGKDGKLLREIDIGEARVAQMESGFDFDGDAAPDLAVLATDWTDKRTSDTARSVLIFSGKTGEQLSTHPWISSSAPQTSLAHLSKFPRLVSFREEMKNERECAQLVYFSPDENGNVRRHLPIDDCVTFQAVACMSPDLNGDGIEDLLRGAHEAGVMYGGEVAAYSGKDATLLWRLAGSNDLGASLASGIDFDGDEVPDVLSGAVHVRGQEHNGSVWAISGRTGMQLWTLDRTSP